jgi:hypothetical protein
MLSEALKRRLELEAIRYFMPPSVPVFEMA